MDHSKLTLEELDKLHSAKWLGCWFSVPLEPCLVLPVSLDVLGVSKVNPGVSGQP